MNISLIIVIIFSLLGYHLICKPLAFLLHKSKKTITNYFFNGFNIFDAYYAGFEIGRLVRIFIKLASFSSLKSAQLMKKKLSYVENVKIYKTISRDKEFFQVKAGPFLDVKKVDDLHYLLLKKGMQGAQIVVE